MEGDSVRDSNCDVVYEDNPKVEKMAKDSSGRKMLADISNIQRKPTTLSQDNKSLPNSATVKEYIAQLQKENAALKKLVADKTRIVDLSGAELHKLRITLQKMQQQNLQLAQSHSQLLAELNSGKDRLKDLQLQLGCTNGVLIAKQLELEGKRKNKTCQTNDIKKVKVSEHEEKGERDKEEYCNTTTTTTTTRRQKSKSLGPVKTVQDKSLGDNGRVRGRRQSARFKREEPQDLFDTDNMDLPACPLPEDKMQEDDHEDDSVVKKEEDSATQQHRRSSISRPSRLAVKKVQSYKELNLICKMRRTE